MGRTEKRELISRLSVLLLHLLKWRYLPEKQSPSWEASIQVQRNRLADHLDDNPSLKPLLPKALASGYRDAALEAVAETGLAGSSFPEVCPWTIWKPTPSAALAADDVFLVTRLDRLARSTRDLLNTLAAIAAKGARFRSLADTWADTTTAHGRLILTVLGGLAEFERELIRARTSEGRARAKADRRPSSLSPGSSCSGSPFLLPVDREVERPIGANNKLQARGLTGRPRSKTGPLQPSSDLAAN